MTLDVDGNVKTVFGNALLSCWHKIKMEDVLSPPLDKNLATVFRIWLPPSFTDDITCSQSLRSGNQEVDIFIYLNVEIFRNVRKDHCGHHSKLPVISSALLLPDVSPIVISTAVPSGAKWR